jgi:hypothetical protein
MALLRGENFFLEIGHVRYKKIKHFIVISKMQTYLSDKRPPIKLKKPKKWELSKLENVFFK